MRDSFENAISYIREYRKFTYLNVTDQLWNWGSEQIGDLRSTGNINILYQAFRDGKPILAL